MERLILKHRSWLQRLAEQLREGAGGIMTERGLWPEPVFRERLIEERKRAERSHKAILLMLVHAEELGKVANMEEIADELGEELNTCVRATDTCGLLSDNGLIGVILTEIGADKIEKAQQVVAEKVRAKLAALLGEDSARIGIGFHVVAPAAVPPAAADQAALHGERRQGAKGRDRLTAALDAEQEASLRRPERAAEPR